MEELRDAFLNSILCEIGEKNLPQGELSGVGEIYGVDIDNDVFMMHPYCWCDKEDCSWCGEVGIMPEILRKGLNIKYSETKRSPNFWYKPLDFKVWWYKYIGRGVETNKILTIEQLEEMREKCINVSINKGV